MMLGNKDIYDAIDLSIQSQKYKCIWWWCSCKKGEKCFFIQKGGKYLPHKQDFMTLLTLAYFYNTKNLVKTFIYHKHPMILPRWPIWTNMICFNVYKHLHSETFKIAYLNKHLLWTSLLCSAHNISRYKILNPRTWKWCHYDISGSAMLRGKKKKLSRLNVRPNVHGGRSAVRELPGP